MPHRLPTAVHIRDLNATIRHCLGMDPKPTGAEPATAVKGILA